MGLFSQIAPISALMDSAAGLVRELRQPTLSNEAFAGVLKEQIQAQSAAAAKQAEVQTLADQARGITGQYIGQQDANGDGRLTLAESGLESEAFARLDLDGDGLLSADELQPHFTRALIQQQGANTTPLED